MMTRIVKYFPEGNTAPVETLKTTIDSEGVKRLKQYAQRYPNCNIYQNSHNNLCINYGRTFNEIINR